MCQCLICGCCWWNYCGVCCGGIHQAFCICSYWLCKPDDLRLIDPQCCHICAFDGWGYNCLCEGIICCAPGSVQQWSGLRAAGRTASDLNKQTIIINNTGTPYMQAEMGYQGSPSNYGTPGYGAPPAYGSPGPSYGNMAVNVNGGSPGQPPYAGMGYNANVNSGPGGVNVRTNF